MKKYNILFISAGGKATRKKLGFGHIFRIINLAKEFKTHNLYFLIKDFGGAKEQLHKNNFFNFYERNVNSTIKQDIDHCKEIIKKIQPALIIIDEYKISCTFVKSIKKNNKVVIISDLRIINFQADLVVNGFIGFKNSIFTNKFGTKCLLGPQYQILNKNFFTTKKQKKKFKLLVTFGGFDEKNLSNLVISELLNFPNKIKTKIILGPGSRKCFKLNKTKKFQKNFIKITQSTKNMFKEMNETEFGLCAGGITTYEFASLKIPFGIICQEKHQLITAKYWQENDLAINMGFPSKLTRKKLRNFLYLIDSGQFFIKKNNLIIGYGTHRVKNEIINLILGSH